MAANEWFKTPANDARVPQMEGAEPLAALPPACLGDSLPACPVCGGRLIEQRHKRICAICHTICETCCEGGRG